MEKRLNDFYFTTNRLIAIGDINGDSHVLHHILVNLAKVCEIDESIVNDENWLKQLKWKKDNNSTVVFCGDMVDRRSRYNENTVDDEDSDYNILITLCRLADEAKDNGGMIIILLCNHELLNFENRFSHVSQKGKSNINKRKKQFKPGSEFAKLLAKHCLVSVQINNYVFVHGGFCIDTPSIS